MNKESSGEQTGVDYEARIAELQALLQQQQAQIEALLAEIRAEAEEPAEGGEPPPAEALAARLMADTQFVATGPAPAGQSNVGFRTNLYSGFRRGVQALGSSGSPADVGVLGMSTSLQGGEGNGTGVWGHSAHGTGVKGTSTTSTGSGTGTGVQGWSDRGYGVEGFSNNAMGVFGRGLLVGVWGVSEFIGVLGGSSTGTIEASQPTPVSPDGVYMGVAGAAGPLADLFFTFSYGGWFSRGVGTGTAPLHLEPASVPDPPEAAQRGDVFVDNEGRLWFCTDTGHPQITGSQAVWRQVQLM